MCFLSWTASGFWPFQNFILVFFKLSSVLRLVCLAWTLLQYNNLFWIKCRWTAVFALCPCTPLLISWCWWSLVLASVREAFGIFSVPLGTYETSWTISWVIFIGLYSWTGQEWSWISSICLTEDRWSPVSLCSVLYMNFSLDCCVPTKTTTCFSQQTVQHSQQPEGEDEGEFQIRNSGASSIRRSLFHHLLDAEEKLSCLHWCSSSSKPASAG